MKSLVDGVFLDPEDLGDLDPGQALPRGEPKKLLIARAEVSRMPGRGPRPQGQPASPSEDPRPPPPGVGSPAADARRLRYWLPTTR